MTLHLTITTPDSVLIDDEVQEITIPTTSGEVTILPGHAELVSELSDGEVTVTRNGKQDHIALIGGFLQVNPKEVTILANYASHGKDLTLIEIEEAKKRAEKAMQEHASKEDFAIAEAAFKKAILELKVARKQKAS